jgi:hypothetical protein
MKLKTSVLPTYEANWLKEYRNKYTKGAGLFPP